MNDLDLAALFAADPDDFVRERDRLAKELARAGRREDAQVVKALARPTLSVWATNQAVRRAPEALRMLLVASEELRQAFSEGDATLRPATQTRYAQALAAQRQAVGTLVDAAQAALVEAGRKAEHAALARVENNVRRGAADPAARNLLRSGQLRADVPVAELETLLAELPALGPRGPANEPEGDQASARERAQRRKAAEHTLVTARRALDRAQAEADERGRERKLAEEQLAHAHHRADDAARALAIADESVKAAERALAALDDQ